MSEFSWGGSEVAEETRPATQEPGTLAMSADEFAALEERVLRAVNLVKRERAARADAEERATAAEARATAAETRVAELSQTAGDHEQKAAEHAQTIEKLHDEISGLRSERDQVRQRVERILSQLDAIES